MQKARLILHPVRLRIVTTLMGRQMTTKALAAALPDVAQATLYRHLNTLAEAGVLIVVEENPVRGTIEKVYALALEEAQVSAEDAAQMSKDEHMHMFTTFVTKLLHDFSAYLEARQQIDLAADGLSYTQAPLNLSDAELRALAIKLGDTLQPYLDLPPAPERRRRIFTTILMPDGSPSDEPEEANND